MSTAKANSPKPRVKWLSCSEIIRLQDATREARTGPQPWILRKLTVGFVFLIIGWTTYVYIGRVCLRMIRREDGVVGSRGLGSKHLTHCKPTLQRAYDQYAVTFIVIFSLLWFILTWSYTKVRVRVPVLLSSPLFPTSPMTYRAPLDRHHSPRLCTRPCPKVPSSRSSHLRYPPSSPPTFSQHVLLTANYTLISPKVPHPKALRLVIHRRRLEP